MSRIQFVALCIGVSSLWAASPPMFSPLGKMAVWQNNLLNFPTWTGGAFITMDPGPRTQDDPSCPAPNIYVSGAQGNFTTQIRIPGAVWIQNRGIARGADGTIAVCGDAKDSAGQHWPYLAFFTPNNPEPVVVRTEPYHPTGLTMAPDGTVWVKGVDWTQGTNGYSFTKRDRNGILRHFSRTGTLLGSALPQWDFRMKEVVQGDRIASSADRVGWLQYSGVGSGTSPADGSYFEVAADRTVSKIPLPPFRDGEVIDALAITDSGRVLISKSIHRAGTQLYTWDREQGVWQTVQFPASGFEGTGYYMLGATGDTVAFWTNGTSGFNAQLVKIQ